MAEELRAEAAADAEQEIHELEEMLRGQTSLHGEEETRLRALIDAGTRDLAELSAECGQRDQQQEERIVELLAQVAALQQENRAQQRARSEERRENARVEGVA